MKPDGLLMSNARSGNGGGLGGNGAGNAVLVEIQTRLEFQDLTIAELNDVITDQQKQLDSLSRRLEMLGDNLKVLEASVETEQHDEKPPHY
jgi:SlyX protein